MADVIAHEITISKLSPKLNVCSASLLEIQEEFARLDSPIITDDVDVDTPTSDTGEINPKPEPYAEGLGLKSSPPGENGDGHYVQLHQGEGTVQLKSSKIEDQKQQGKDVTVTEIFSRAIEHTNVRSHSIPSALTVMEKPSWLSDEQPPKLHSSESHLEMQPAIKQVQMTKAKELPAATEAEIDSVCEAKKVEEEKGACKAVLPKSSTLILKRDLLEPSCFSGPIKIMNSTSFNYGFMIFTNKFTLDKLIVTPKMGLIKPQTEVSINVKTNPETWKKIFEGKCMLEVKIFRAICEDPAFLTEYYNKLAEQHPALIRSQLFEKIIIWDSGDLPKPKRPELKSVTVTEVDSKVLNTVKTNMLLANQNLREIFHEMTNIIQALQVTMLVGVFVFGFALFLPHILATANEPEPEPEPELKWHESLMQSGQNVWDMLNKSVHETVVAVADYLGYNN